MMKNEFEILDIKEPSDLRNKVISSFKNWIHMFPKNHSALILLKPNFNSHLNALTGNTTDLRLLATVIEIIKSQGYSNLVLADGPSGGFDRESVSVIHRLRADKLATYYGVKIIDLNNCSDSRAVTIGNGKSAEIANIIFESDFLINMPKLKTHCEVGMSVCLKNIMGACIGIENKRKMHENILARNIIYLNKVIKPNLHIIDGLIAMEGNGPSRGEPKNYGKVILGINPFQLDYICARLTKFPCNQVKTLVEAQKMGFISQKDLVKWDAINLEEYEQEFIQPKVSPLVAFVLSPKSQKFLTKIRHKKVIKTLCSTKLVKNLFYITGISQEKIKKAEMRVHFNVELDGCNNCCKCSDYCPISISFNTILKGGCDTCIGCLYCYSVCPKNCIKLKGDVGFFSEQIKLFDNKTRSIA